MMVADHILHEYRDPSGPLPRLWRDFDISDDQVVLSDEVSQQARSQQAAVDGICEVWRRKCDAERTGYRQLIPRKEQPLAGSPKIHVCVGKSLGTMTCHREWEQLFNA